MQAKGKSYFQKFISATIPQQPLFIRMTVTILVVTIAIALRIWPLRILDTRFVWLTFYPAIMISALFGGFVSGLFSIALSAFAILFLWPLFANTPFITDYIDWIAITIFGLNGVMISSVAHAMRRANISATQAQKRAELFNRELESFSYSVSHDLRAPLRAISELSLALKEDCEHLLDKEAQGYLNRIQTESQRMGALINDLLKLSVITRATVSWQDVNLSEIAEVVKKRIIEENPQQAITFTISPDLFTRGDPNLLEIAITQLFDNACKFTSKVKAAKIEFGKINTSNEEVYFIRDNGAGFNMEYAQNLFGAFQRMHPQSVFPGTGIGLATVKRILNLHQGKIWVETSENQGATFYFTINEPKTSMLSMS